MDALKKEIKEALLGSLIPSDGRLQVSTNRWAKYRAGMQDGYDKVRIFGVMSRKRWYLSRKNAKQIRELAVKGMQNMGRMMELSSAPELEAVYCSYLLNNPAILTFQRNQDGTIELTAYSGRGFSGWVSCFRTLNRFQKEVPEVLQRMSEEDEQQKKTELREQVLENKLLNKQAKKDKKQEKKRLKKEKRKARLERMVGFHPSKLLSKPEAGNESINSKQLTAENSFEAAQGETTSKKAFKAAQGETASKKAFEAAQEEKVYEKAFEEVQETAADNSFDAMKEEQARLQMEAEKAKLEAQAAQARLEAAQAKLAAQEAQAKLAEVEARLQANGNGGTK